MFKSSSTENESSFISETCQIEGNIFGSSELNVAGLIDGDIISSELKILDTALIKGNIKAAIIEIDGQVNGSIEANNVYLGRNAVIRGDISFFETLKTEEGADVDGYIKKNRIPTKSSATDESQSKSRYSKPTLVKDTDKKEAI